VKRTTPVVNISSSQTAVRVPRKKIAALVEFVARSEGASIEEADIAVVTAREIARLNRRYLNRCGATDVLSFDLSRPHGDRVVVQLVLCGDIAVREARLRGLGPQRELLLYVVHGLLHVLGHDGVASAPAEKMHAREEELLEAFLRAWGRR